MLKTAIFVVVVMSVAVSGAWLFVPLEQLGQAAKSRGYLAYTPDEAITLAYERCGSCHGIEKVLLYCSRCGPPFIVATHYMKKYVELANLDGNTVEAFSDAEIVAITQVWNALVGNWESDWREQDLRKLLGNDTALIELLNTPPEKRPIELALADKTAPGSYQEQIQ